MKLTYPGSLALPCLERDLSFLRCHADSLLFPYNAKPEHVYQCHDGTIR